MYYSVQQEHNFTDFLLTDEDCPTQANVTLAVDTPTVLQSPNHPGTYSSNTHCLWLLVGKLEYEANYLKTGFV